MIRVTDSKNWFQMWDEDKKNMVRTMTHNMLADLCAGYSPCGNTIKRYRAEIDAYCVKYESELNAFKHMTDAEINRWCFYDMKKRGVIE